MRQAVVSRFSYRRLGDGKETFVPWPRLPAHSLGKRLTVATWRNETTPVSAVQAYEKPRREKECVTTRKGMRYNEFRHTRDGPEDRVLQEVWRLGWSGQWGKVAGRIYTPNSFTGASSQLGIAPPCWLYLEQKKIKQFLARLVCLITRQFLLKNVTFTS